MVSVLSRAKYSAHIELGLNIDFILPYQMSRLLHFDKIGKLRKMGGKI
jgi:hypothetical protein